MGDVIDQAQEINEDFQAFALEHQKLNREPANYTGADCIDCHKEIPKDRRKAVPGCRRCLSCQEIYENWSAL